MECGALGKMDIIISDASAVLRNLPWPGTGGLVSDFINTVRQHVEKLLIDYDQVFFIFDRYNSDSIKGKESCPAWQMTPYWARAAWSWLVPRNPLQDTRWEGWTVSWAQNTPWRSRCGDSKSADMGGERWEPCYQCSGQVRWYGCVCIVSTLLLQAKPYLLPYDAGPSQR